MSDVGISISRAEMSKFVNWLSSQEGRLKQEARVIVEGTLRDVERKAKELAPVGKGFGLLRSSIHREKSRDGLGGSVYTGRKYAAYQEWGTGTKVNVPSFVKELFGVDSMDWKGAGIRKVNIKPQPYLFSAARIGYMNMIAKLKGLGFDEVKTKNTWSPKLTYRPDY